MERREDDVSPPSTAGDREMARSEAQAGSETAEDRIYPNPTGPSPEQSVPAGPLGRQLSNISADLLEILPALQNLGEIISERVVHEVRAFRREVEDRLESMERRVEGRPDVHDAWIDAWYESRERMRREINGLRREIRLLMAMVGIQTVFLGALLTMGII